MNYTKEKSELLLMQQIYSSFMSIAKKIDKQGDKSFKGLTAKQYMVILAVRLSSHDGTTMVNIAKKLGTTKQNINRLIPMLEKKGYVVKSICESNKRAVNIKITDSGLKAMLEYAGIGISFMTDVLNGFTKSEMEALWSLLQKLCYSEKIDYSQFLSEANKLYESEYSELLTKILEKYKEDQP